MGEDDNPDCRCLNPMNCEDKARKAVEAVAAYENRLISVENKLDRLSIELRVYAGLVITISLAILAKVYK